MSNSVLSKFSSRKFISSGFTFKSLIQVNEYKLCFVYGIRKPLGLSSCSLLHVAVQFFQHHLLKRLSSRIVYTCLLCFRLIDHMGVSLFLGSFALLIYVSVFVPVPTVLINIASQQSLKSGIMKLPALFFFLKISLMYFLKGSLLDSYKFQDYLVLVCEKFHGYFNRDSTE